MSFITASQVFAYAIKIYDQWGNRIGTYKKEGENYVLYDFYDNKIDSKALNTAIGYKELFKYFDGELTKEEALDLIKKNSRHYAKRQYTWFNHQVPTIWVETDYDNFDNTINKVMDLIEKKNN